MQARGDPLGKHASAEPARGVLAAAAVDAPVEDQADLVGASDVEVVPDDLLEEHPPTDGPIQYLGQGELRLQHRKVIAVAGGPVRAGERVRQARQPLAQQRVDLLGPEPIADRLHRLRVGAGGEAVVQGGEPQARLRRLAFSPLVPR
ncbi:MAG: hypothetical protein QOJ30_5 [Pseudonocardiales bacterium]|nr:hypothetical protein [Pseudonocardiales bacterium]